MASPMYPFPKCRAYKGASVSCPARKMAMDSDPAGMFVQDTGNHVGDDVAPFPPLAHVEYMLFN